jgi:replicative DNA helicase
MADILKDRVPPHTDDAERAVLGAMLLETNAVGTAAEKLSDKDFYSRNHATIFLAILALYNKSTVADLLTLREELRQQGKLEAVGGEAYIAGLTNVVPTTANIEYYCKVEADCSLRREIIRMAYDAIADGFDESNDARQTLEKTEQRIFELDNKRHTISYLSTEVIIPEVLAKIEENYNRKGALSGVPTGFDELDKITAGFQPQDLIIIGARPSQGKTALALSMAKHIAVQKKKPVGFFSLEMSNIQVAMRILSAEAQVNSNALRTGIIEKKDIMRLPEAAGRIHSAPLYIVDVPNMKLLDLRSQARRMRLQEKVEIIFIDYLGLIALEASSSNFIQRHEMIAEISRSLKSLARELNIPIVVLSQLNRQAADGSKPGLAVIRDSGAVEQDADLVMFIHREADAEKKAAEQNSDSIETKLIIAKHRNGETRDIDLLFQKKYTLFVSESKDEPYG